MLIALEDAEPATCGGKAGALAALVRAGLPVPAGVVVPFAAYRSAARAGGVTASTAPAEARRALAGSPLPGDLVDALADALRVLGDVPLAVRSSAGDEDGERASAAGQHVSVLGVRGVPQVADAVRACWVSLWSGRAAAYRAAAGCGPGSTDAEDPVMAVLVQRLVDADVAGVLFTADGPDGVDVVEAAWGLGTGVVGGSITPDTYRVDPDGAVTSTVTDKRTRVDRADGRVVTHDVAPADRARPALTDHDVRRVARLGRRVAAVRGAPQDVEWALTGGDLWVLQARPVTAALPGPATSGGRAAHAATLTGTPGSRGTATGPARVVRGPDDIARVRPGDVLVCPWTDPAWTPLLGVVAGVVTETGGVLSHAAIVARERGIPAVLGVTGATTTFADSTLLTVDGSAGTVTTHP